MSDRAVLDEDMIRLYEEARRRFLKNEPLCWESGRGTLSAGETDALKAVGLSAEPFDEGSARDLSTLEPSGVAKG